MFFLAFFFKLFLKFPANPTSGLLPPSRPGRNVVGRPLFRRAISLLRHLVVHEADNGS